MVELGEHGVNLLLQFMELAGDSGVALSLDDLAPLMDKLAIRRGGQGHFTLVWANHHRMRGIGPTAPTLDDLKRQYPQWSAKFDRLAALEGYLGDIAQASRLRVTGILQARGYQIIRDLKAGQRSFTCLATPPTAPGQELYSMVPMVLKAGFGAYQLRLLKREYLLGRTLNSNYCLRPASIEARDDVAWITLDYCPMGSLEKANGLSHEEIWQFWVQSAKALAHLHQRMVCHNDIKASNLLLDSHKGKTRVLLSDLEYATREGKPVNRQRAVWDHPEWETGQAARKRDDVYRLGMTIAWLLAPGIALPEKLSTTSRLEVVSHLPAPFQDPLIQCLRDESLERIETGAELHRVLNGSKDHFPHADQQCPGANSNHKSRQAPG